MHFLASSKHIGREDKRDLRTNPKINFEKTREDMRNQEYILRLTPLLSYIVHPESIQTI